MPSHYGRQELFGISPHWMEDVVISMNVDYWRGVKAKTLRRKISVMRSKYPNLRNPKVAQRFEKLVADLEMIENGGV